MALNLKQIFYTDSDQIKLDKVNYNFDQLITNGGGPQGPVGVGGSQGAQGTMGFQGPIGITGPRGFQGPEGAAAGQHWYLIEDDPAIAGSVDTLIPKHEPGLNPPSVVIGYKSDAPEYSTPENQSQLVVHRYDSEPTSNIKLEANGVDSAFHFELTNTGDLKMYFSDADNITNTLPPNKVVYETQSFTIQDSAQTELINVNPTDSTISTNAKFKEDLEVQGKLTIASGNPDTDKIAVAKDSTGEIEFKSVQDLGGSVPVGTIVSLIPSYFEDNSKFIQEQLNETVNANDQKIHFTVGSGINEYAGWYICNGKTWTDDTISYNVPDLCSFSYTIDDNANSNDPNSQGSRVVTNDSIHIMGGSDINLTADFVSGAYNITATVDVDSVNLQQSTGTILKVRRLPQIIYLGTENMYWIDGGVDQAPDTTMTLNFFDVNGNISHTETKTESQGSSYTGTITLTAPAGYIWSSTGVSFSTVSWPGQFTGGQTIDPSDATKLYVDISWSQPPIGTYTATTYGPFNYDSSNFVTLNTANYNIQVTGGSIDYNTGTISGATLGQNAPLVNASNASTYNILPPSGRIFSTQNSGVNVTTTGYTFTPSSTLLPAPNIQGVFTATPFTVPPANGGTIEVTVLSDLDLSNVDISSLSGAVISGGSQVLLNWSATNATSDMTWYIEGYSNTSNMFPSLSLATFTGSQFSVTPAGNNLYSASFPIQSIPNHSGSNNWLHFRIRVAETANLTNIGLDEETTSFDFF